jgi:hypothetical protein
MEKEYACRYRLRQGSQTAYVKYDLYDQYDQYAVSEAVPVMTFMS